MWATIQKARKSAVIGIFKRTFSDGIVFCTNDELNPELSTGVAPYTFAANRAANANGGARGTTSLHSLSNSEG
ncbi:hypothetical protein QFZ34_000350 [Phyllobacterium ifriqiyense]|uniref:Uncharacterized protein n=1 Tax=Phyllobacterium ifriqiyense TaxID=314238 RepID=A0ABU0S378_9HYPH|nr:hypothetical protein [Phyllobacterium ifriqiyense]